MFGDYIKELSTEELKNYPVKLSGFGAFLIRRELRLRERGQNVASKNITIYHQNELKKVSFWGAKNLARNNKLKCLECKNTINDIHQYIYHHCYCSVECEKGVKK